MPTSDRILAGLTAIAGSGVVVAVLWHVTIAAAVAAIALGWRPSQRLARILLAAPLVSVAAFAFAFDNPFNGSVFAVGATALVILGGFARSERIVRGGALASTMGIASIAFGAFYPHFLDLDVSPLAYAYLAPVGLVPCPTLALAVGFALLCNGLGAHAWTAVLAALGLFYGLFGMLRLGVYLDVGLVVSAGALAVLALRAHLAGRSTQVLATH